ncbi:MAG: rhodanese-like domain-containing protein [Patescibacteria group bacterium]
MRNKLFIGVLLAALLVVGGVVFAKKYSGGEAEYKQITAQEAYDMIKNGEASLVDVRTMEEVVWVGSPALEAGGSPVAYLIPWKFWTGVDEAGKSTFELNGDFNALVEQTFPDKEQTLIFICRSGKRSSAAIESVKDLGYKGVYEIDNPLKEAADVEAGKPVDERGAHGGLQGTSYSDAYAGYRGYPDRLQGGQIKVETETDKIKNADTSVSWMDTGLPITQKVDVSKVPVLLSE